MKVMKKPIVLDAWDTGSSFVIPRWAAISYLEGDLEVVRDEETEEVIEFSIMTLEGKMRGVHGDYLLKGTRGEIWPVRKDIFEETYDIVEE